MKKSFILIFIQIFICYSIAFPQSSGGSDVSFSTDSKNITTFLGNAVARGSVIQSDGKIVAVGNDGNGYITVVRYKTDGELDNTFSGNGKVSTNISNLFAQAYAVAIQTDGKIMVVGNVHNLPQAATHLYDFIVLRYLSNGTLDNTFDTDGILQTNVSLVDFYYDVKIQSDGKILLAGSQNSAWIIRRLNANGTLDTSFGNAGTTSPPLQGAAKSLIIQTDDKIVIGGDTYAFNANTRDFAAVRLTSNGSLDTSFDTDGIAVTDIGSSTDDYGNSVAVQENGKIVLVGKTFSGSKYNIALVRYNTDGKLDISFSGDGKQISNLSAGDDIANSVALQPNGTIVIAGSTLTPQFTYIDLGGVGHIVSENYDFVVLNYNSSGNLDTDFSTDGKVNVAFEEGQDDFGYGMILQNDGKIVVVGSAPNGATTDFAICRLHGITGFSTLKNRLYTNFGTDADQANCMAIQADEKIVVAGLTISGTDRRFAIARYNKSGLLDNTFSSDGKLIISSAVLQNAAQANEIAIQTDGKILVAGQAFNGTTSDFAVIRLNSNGSFDNTFGTNGVVLIDVVHYDYCSKMKIQPDGKIILAGHNYDINGTYFFSVIRLNTNGSLDTGFDGDGKKIIQGNTGSDDFAGLELYDEKIILSGTGYDGMNQVFVAYRLNSDGSFDTTFDSDGKVSTSFGTQGLCYASAMQPDGKLILGGNLAGSGATLVRYLLDGSLDNSFGTNGIYTSTSPNETRFFQIIVKGNSKILVGGVSLTNSIYAMYLSQLNTNGVVDNTFGINGDYTFAQLGYDHNALQTMALGKYDRIYLASTYSNGANSDFTLSVFMQCKTLLHELILQHSADDINADQSLSPIRGATIHATNWILNTAKIDYESEKYIQLNPGFSTQNGAVFKAKIGINCSYSVNPNDP